MKKRKTKVVGVKVKRKGRQTVITKTVKVVKKKRSRKKGFLEKLIG